MSCYSDEDIQKGINYPKSQVVVVEPVFRQRQSDSGALRPAVFLYSFIALVIRLSLFVASVVIRLNHTSAP